MTGIHILADIDAISHCVAEKWIALSADAIKKRQAFHVALSGGSTPKRLYQRLAEPAYSQKIDWHNTHIYFGDERSVPPQDSDSNFKMASDALLNQVDIPAANIHRMPADSEDIQKSADDYASLLEKNLSGTGSTTGDVKFDLVLLGMGDDGHTASLFPGTTILQEKARLVSAVYVEKLSTWRMSLTFPVINNARNIAVMVTGENKKEILAIVHGNAEPVYPIQLLEPQGEIDWYIDESAAQLL